MTAQKRPNIVSGTISTIADLDRTEAWLQDWLAEDPVRMGLGELKTADKEPAQDEDGNPAFLAADDDHYFSVDVQLGEVDASHGFQVLDNWARNRVRHPDKTHVAVLVTETAGERYRTTLEALTEHLPLVVVEMQAWRGETEAVLVPRIVLSSDDLEFTAVGAEARPPAEATVEEAPEVEAESDDAYVADDAAVEDSVETDAAEEEGSEVVDKDDTGVVDPWQLPKPDVESPDANGGGILSPEMLKNR